MGSFRGNATSTQLPGTDGSDLPSRESVVALDERQHGLHVIRRRRSNGTRVSESAVFSKVTRAAFRDASRVDLGGHDRARLTIERPSCHVAFSRGRARARR